MSKYSDFYEIDEEDVEEYDEDPEVEELELTQEGTSASFDYERPVSPSGLTNTDNVGNSGFAFTGLAEQDRSVRVETALQQADKSVEAVRSEPERSETGDLGSPLSGSPSQAPAGGGLQGSGGEVHTAREADGGICEAGSGQSDAEHRSRSGEEKVGTNSHSDVIFETDPEAEEGEYEGGIVNTTKRSSDIEYPFLFLETTVLAQHKLIALKSMLRNSVIDPNVTTYNVYLKYDKQVLKVGVTTSFALRAILKSEVFKDFTKYIKLNEETRIEGDMLYALCGFMN